MYQVSAPSFCAASYSSFSRGVCASAWARPPLKPATRRAAPPFKTSRRDGLCFRVIVQPPAGAEDRGNASTLEHACKRGGGRPGSDAVVSVSEGRGAGNEAHGA